MPKDKIKAAIDKAFGSGADAAVYENIVYEGYGPAGVAVYVECLTDNRNRTAADVRSAFSHAGGNLAPPAPLPSSSSARARSWSPSRSSTRTTRRRTSWPTALPAMRKSS